MDPSLTGAAKNKKGEGPSLESVFGLSIHGYCKNNSMEEDSSVDIKGSF